MTSAAKTKEILTLKLGYKAPNGNQSQLLTFTIVDEGLILDKTSNDFRFAASVAAFGMLLRGSEYKGNITYQDVKKMAEEAAGDDKAGYRKEFITMIDKAASLTKEAALDENKAETSSNKSFIAIMRICHKLFDYKVSGY